jgi:hypothetical protein
MMSSASMFRLYKFEKGEGRVSILNKSASWKGSSQQEKGLSCVNSSDNNVLVLTPERIDAG